MVFPSLKSVQQKPAQSLSIGLTMATIIIEVFKIAGTYKNSVQYLLTLRCRRITMVGPVLVAVLLSAELSLSLSFEQVQHTVPR